MTLKQFKKVCERFRIVWEQTDLRAGPCMVLGTQMTIETCLPLVHFQPAISEVDSQIGHS